GVAVSLLRGVVALVDEVVVLLVGPDGEVVSAARGEDVHPVLAVRVVGLPARNPGNPVVVDRGFQVSGVGLALRRVHDDVEAQALLPLLLEELGGGLAGRARAIFVVKGGLVVLKSSHQLRSVGPRSTCLLSFGSLSTVGTSGLGTPRVMSSSPFWNLANSTFPSGM